MPWMARSFSCFALMLVVGCVAEIPATVDFQTDGSCDGSVEVPDGYPSIGGRDCGGRLLFFTSSQHQHDWASPHGLQPQGDGFYDWRVAEPPLVPGAPLVAIDEIEVNFPSLTPGSYSALDCAMVQLLVPSGLGHRTGEGSGAFAERSLSLEVVGATAEAVWGTVSAKACSSFGSGASDAGNNHHITCEEIRDGRFSLRIEGARRDSGGCQGPACCKAAADCPDSILPEPMADDPFAGRCLRMACMNGGCRVRDHR